MALVFAMPGNEHLAGELAGLTASKPGTIEFRRFPDGESYVRVRGGGSNEDAFLVCTLAHPDENFLPLVFAARAIRDAGARRATLVAPYLAYMRQDRAFNPGEAISSRIFADLVSGEFDRLITVDPHLHRLASLEEIYRIPVTVVHTSELIGAWVRDHVSLPVVFGPDAESAQWVEQIARSAGCPWAVFQKERRGDRDVHLVPRGLEQCRSRTPVLADDTISSGATMIEAAKAIRDHGLAKPYCIAVHALFDAATASELEHHMQAVLATDTVPGRYSKLGVAPLVARQLSVSRCTLRS